MAITHRPGAKQGIGAQIANEVKLHPIASVGVVALVGLGIWALATRNQGTPDQTTTPSDSFWQGYSTAQEDFLNTRASTAQSVSNPNLGQVPVSTQPPATTSGSTTNNTLFTPQPTLDYQPGVTPTQAHGTHTHAANLNLLANAFGPNNINYVGSGQQSGYIVKGNVGLPTGLGKGWTATSSGGNTLIKGPGATKLKLKKVK